MKLIAENKTSFIVDMSKTELANLIGYCDISESEVRNKIRGVYNDLCVGVEINISKMYEQLNSMKNNEQRFKQASDLLAKIADTLLLVDPIIRQIQSEPDENK